MRRGGGAQSCEARWEDRRVVSHLHIADVAFLLISTKHRRSSAAPAAVRKIVPRISPLRFFALSSLPRRGGVRTLIAAPRCATFVRLALLPV